MSTLKFGLAQIHPVVGDFQHNAELVISRIDEAKAAGCDVVVFGELALLGYPPQDLLLREDFVEQGNLALEKIREASAGISVIVGSVTESDGDLYNSAVVFSDTELIHRSHKQFLPNYDVFDEQRYFTASTESSTVELCGVSVGVVICEDIWESNSPAHSLCEAGAKVIIAINASPYSIGQQSKRSEVCNSVVEQTGTALVYVNLVGGQDGLVFDGSSKAYGSNVNEIEAVSDFSEGLAISEVDTSLPAKAEPNLTENSAWEAQVWRASCRGLRDYVHDNGFKTVGVGLSGGIDSAMTVAIAADALGPENVHAVGMPSKYSSDHSLTDSEQLCSSLGVRFTKLTIEETHQAFSNALTDYFGGRTPDGLTDENLQSRLRGVSLMTLSNELGWLILATGNKSELAVGYSTLYGDTVGAYGVIRDLWKTQVYQLAEWYNSSGIGNIPQNILSKAPSAELRPDQTDEQTLGDYDTLDAILKLHIDNHLGAKAIASKGYELDQVKRVLRLIDIAEYKRRQSPIGTRLTNRAFVSDRRMPITHRYRQD